MLRDLLNFDKIMTAGRSAGGHTEIMDCLFIGAEVIASWVEEDYQGNLAYAYRLSDGRIVLVTDSFGSCSGCDAYEDCSDQELRHLVTCLANDAHVFDTVADAMRFIESTVPSDKAAYYHDRTLSHLFEPLSKLI